MVMLIFANGIKRHVSIVDGKEYKEKAKEKKAWLGDGWVLAHFDAAIDQSIMYEVQEPYLGGCKMHLFK